MGIKISELQELSDLKDDDVLAIVDSDGNATRKIKYSTIKKNIGIEGVKGIYESLSELKSDNPDHSNIYAVLNEDAWYYWNENYDEENVSSQPWLYGGEYPINLKDFSQKINEKSVLQVANANEITYNAGMANTLFPLNKTINKDGNAFSIENNTIKVNKNMKKARIDLLIRYASIKNVQNYGFTIKTRRNATITNYLEISQTLSKDWDAVKATSYLFDLQVGDTIEMVWNGSFTGNVIVSGQLSSCLTVCEI